MLEPQPTLCATCQRLECTERLAELGLIGLLQLLQTSHNRHRLLKGLGHEAIHRCCPTEIVACKCSIPQWHVLCDNKGQIRISNLTLVMSRPDIEGVAS